MPRETVELLLVTRETGDRSRVEIPAEYTTADWAVHRPHAYTKADGTPELFTRGWRVTCRHSGMYAWYGTNLNEAKKAARALQATSDERGRIPQDGKAPSDVLLAHAAAATGTTRKDAA